MEKTSSVYTIKCENVKTAVSLYLELKLSTNIIHKKIFFQRDSESPFKNGWNKIKLLSPYLWPRKELLLQYKIFLCLVLLFGGRVINLFVPVYNKLIGKFIFLY